MIKDMVGSYRQAKQLYPSLLFDNLELGEGLYIRLNVQIPWEEQINEFHYHHVQVTSKGTDSQQVELIQWVKERDYYSSLIDMNKPVDPKKQVHSNNPFALFVKRDVFLEEKSTYTMMENITRYLSFTKVDAVKQKWLALIPGVKEIDYFKASEFKDSIEYLLSDYRSQCIQRIEQWYAENLEALQASIQSMKTGKYVKLFFDLDPFVKGDSALTNDEMVKFEYELYTIPKVFNSNNYNQLDNGNLLGLPSFDISMNSKKPYLEHKTMRMGVPDRVPIDQALLIKEVAEWMLSKDKFTIHRLGYETGICPTSGSVPEGTYHVYVDGKENEIRGFENVPFPPNRSIYIEWQNVLMLRDHVSVGYKSYDSIDHSAQLQKQISHYFFHGQMNGQFLMNEPSIKPLAFTATMQALYMQSRQAFYDFIYKGTSITISPIFAGITLRLVEEQLLHLESSRLTDLADAMNLRYSIIMMLDEKGGKAMADRIQSTITALRRQLTGLDQPYCANDSEFYFLVGQLAYYLVSRSKTTSDKKTGGLLEPFLRAKDASQLKKRLEESYALYKYDISLGYQKFNRAFSMVMGYEPDQTDANAKDFLMAGIFADNLFYEKAE